MTWKALEDKNWKRAFKALTLVEVLFKRGSTSIIAEIKRDIWRIQKFKDHKVMEGGKDVAGGMREKATTICEFCEDTDRLNKERDKNYEMYEKMRGIGTRSTKGSFSESSPRSGGGSPANRADTAVDDFCAATGATREKAQEWIDKAKGNAAVAISDFKKDKEKKPGWLEQKRRADQVQSILEVDEKRATDLLKECDWDVDAAISKGEKSKSSSKAQKSPPSESSGSESSSEDEPKRKHSSGTPQGGWPGAAPAGWPAPERRNSRDFSGRISRNSRDSSAPPAIEKMNSQDFGGSTGTDKKSARDFGGGAFVGNNNGWPSSPSSGFGMTRSGSFGGSPTSSGFGGNNGFNPTSSFGSGGSGQMSPNGFGAPFGQNSPKANGFGQNGFGGQGKQFMGNGGGFGAQQSNTFGSGGPGKFGAKGGQNQNSFGGPSTGFGSQQGKGDFGNQSPQGIFGSQQGKGGFGNQGPPFGGYGGPPQGSFSGRQRTNSFSGPIGQPPPNGNIGNTGNSLVQGKGGRLTRSESFSGPIGGSSTGGKGGCGGFGNQVPSQSNFGAQGGFRQGGGFGGQGGAFGGQGGYGMQGGFSGQGGCCGGKGGAFGKGGW